MKRPGPGVKMAQAAHNPAIHFDRYPRRDPIYAAIHLHEKSPTSSSSKRSASSTSRASTCAPRRPKPLTSPRQAWSSTPSRPPSPASCEYIALAARPRPIRSKHFGPSCSINEDGRITLRRALPRARLFHWGGERPPTSQLTMQSLQLRPRSSRALTACAPG
jgi:hypothetical protein